MAKLQIEDNQRPIVLYDAKKQKAIGIFKQQVTATKYLYGNNNRKQNVGGALKKKQRIHNSLLNTPIAIRYANPDQIKLLGDQEVYMLDESLKKFDKGILVGFNSSRANLYHEHVMVKFDKKY